MTCVNPAAIQITDYDPRWPELAAATIAGLRIAAPGAFTESEHIGSTAVPGLAAKPVIDLMAATTDLDHVSRHEPALAGVGFTPHTNGMTDRLLFVRAPGGVRTHPTEAARYADLKREIVAAGVAPGDYAKAKTALIQELTDRARRERGLPAEPVWEK